MRRVLTAIAAIVREQFFALHLNTVPLQLLTLESTFRGAMSAEYVDAGFLGMYNSQVDQTYLK